MPTADEIDEQISEIQCLLDYSDIESLSYLRKEIQALRKMKKERSNN